MSINQIPQPPAFTQQTSQAGRPGITGYVLAGIAVVIGIAGAIYCGRMFAKGITSFTNEYVTVPGKNVLVLENAGNYKISRNYTSGQFGTTDGLAEDLSGLTITVVRNDTNEKIPLTSHSDYRSRIPNPDEVVERMTFSVSEPCTIVLTGEYIQETANPKQVELKVSGSPSPKFVVYLFGAIGSAGLGLLIALILFIVTIIRRYNASKTIRYPPPAIRM